MNTRTSKLSKAIEIAEAFLRREISKQQRLNPGLNPDEIWAGVSFDGRIVIGTPMFHEGHGVYVNHNGHWKEV